MSTDYVHRAKPKATKKRGAKGSQNRGGKRSPKGGKQQPPKRRFPIISLLLTIVVVGGLGYLLWSISGDGDDQKSQVVEQLNRDTSPVKDTSPLPQKPEEEFSYHEKLKNKTVDVEVPEKPEAGRPYLMQCGSFRKNADAETLKARIAFSGLESEVRRTEGSNGVWYRVVLGPYPKKRTAEKERHILQRANINGCQIWFW